MFISRVTLRFTSDDNEVVIINHLREEVNMNNIFMFYKLITSTSIKLKIIDANNYAKCVQSL